MECCIRWPLQSPNFNPIDMVWDELDRRVKEKQPTSAQHTVCGNSFKTVGKAFQVKLGERMQRVCKAVIKAKGVYFDESKIYFDLFNSFSYVLFHSFDIFTIIIQCRKTLE